MNLIYEQYAVLSVIPPQVVEPSGEVVGTPIDMQRRKRFCFVLSATPEADLSVDVLSFDSDDNEGPHAVSFSTTLTVPESGIVSLAGVVTPLRGRYLTLRVTGGAAVSAVLLSDYTHYPEGTGNLDIALPNEPEEG